jgi:hypothetical protein
MKFKSLGFIITIATILTASQVGNSAVVIGDRIVKHYRQAIARDNPPPSEAFSDRLTGSGLTEAEFKPFFAKLQRAIATDDAIALSKSISYPIYINNSRGKSIAINNSRQAISAYKKFATPSWKQAVIDAKYPELFANYRGVMVDGGKLWIAGICQDKSCTKKQVKISAINFGNM